MSNYLRVHPVFNDGSSKMQPVFSLWDFPMVDWTFCQAVQLDEPTVDRQITDEVKHIFLLLSLASKRLEELITSETVVDIADHLTVT